MRKEFKAKTTCGGCVFRATCGWAGYDHSCPDHTEAVDAERVLDILKSHEEFISAYRRDDGTRVISFGMNNVRWAEDGSDGFEIVWGWIGND